jgi:hypothetical protein
LDALQPLTLAAGGFAASLFLIFAAPFAAALDAVRSPAARPGLVFVFQLALAIAFGVYAAPYVASHDPSWLGDLAKFGELGNSLNDVFGNLARHMRM